MIQVAFKIDPNSKFYEEFFQSKKEKQHFHDLARSFFEQHDLLNNSLYYQTERLGLELTPDQRKRFSKQLLKHEDGYGMSIFKKNSEMQKQWKSNVVDNVDFKTLEKTKFWWIYFIGQGSYNLWDKDGVIYGLLMDNNKTKIDLPDYMTPIKMSEYYMAIESED